MFGVYVKDLRRHPRIGGPVENMLPEFREWVIHNGSGACVLYHHDGRQAALLALRHRGDSGY